jgi:hypothetical protein
MVVRVLQIVTLERVQSDPLEVRHLIMRYITYTFAEKKRKKRRMGAVFRVDWKTAPTIVCSHYTGTRQ